MTVLSQRHWFTIALVAMWIVPVSQDVLVRGRSPGTVLLPVIIGLPVTLLLWIILGRIFDYLTLSTDIPLTLSQLDNYEWSIPSESQ